MPTLAKIKKAAKEQGFCDDMEALGFTLGPGGFWFYRRRGEFLDIVNVWLRSSGERIQFPLETYVDEMFGELYADYNVSDFPKDFFKIVRHGTGLFVTKKGVGLPLHSWEVSSDELLQETFTTVSKLMSTKAAPWFKSIDSQARIYEELSPSVKRGTSGSKLREILL